LDVFGYEGCSGFADRKYGGFICFYAITLKYKLNYDDSLDVISVHGVSGLIWATMT